MVQNVLLGLNASCFQNQIFKQQALMNGTYRCGGKLELSSGHATGRHVKNGEK